MLRRKSTAARILTIGCAGLFCLGASYTWTGGGSDNDWDNGANWSCSGLCGAFPDTASDDATVSGTHNVDLVNETIDDLTLSGTITIGDALGNDPALCVDSLTVTGDSTVSLTEGATISTDTASGPCAR